MMLGMTLSLHLIIIGEECELSIFLKHEDSMEVRIVELVYALAKKVKDMKWSYGKGIHQFYLELEHTHNIILYK